MPEVEREIRTLESPDHGLGLLGRFAHAVTADYLGSAPESPSFHLGYNTLPDPPCPIASHLWHGLDTRDAWRGCGQDLHLFLEVGLESLRAHPVPDPACFDAYARLIAHFNRTDAMGLVWRARMIYPAESVAAWTLTADLLAGRASPGDLTPDVCEAVLVTVAVDRAGATLLAYAPSGGTEDDIIVADAAGSAMDDVAPLLRDLLNAQHAWTTAAYADAPPEAAALAQAQLRIDEAVAQGPR
jgi:hypothetical protein